MKNSIARILLICSLSAVLVSGVNVAALGQLQGKSNVNPAGITTMQPANQATVLGDEELLQIVGGETGCHWFDDGLSVNFGCCLDLWLFELCFEVTIYY